MSDRYVHLFPRCRSAAQEGNLIRLGRHLVINGGAIDAGRGLAFGYVDMTAFRPLPEEVAADSGAAPPPLAYGPLAGVAPLAGEGWSAYCERAFDIRTGDPFISWLQSPMWRKTEPSARGAGLRIAYVLDYGVPHDHVEIAMGQAHTDYDCNGFLWERLDLMSTDVEDETALPGKAWPKWIGAVELNRLRSEVVLNVDNLVPTLVANAIARPDEIEGCGSDEIAALERKLGKMPRSYKDVLGLIGRRAGRLVDRNELWIYADQLEDVNRQARERTFEWGEPDDDPVPDDAVFIGSRYGEHPWFVPAGERDDSPVFHLNSDTGRVTPVGISVWVWVEGLVRDMRPGIRVAPPGRQAERDALDAQLRELRRQQEQRRRAGMAAVWTMLVGGALMVGAALTYGLWRLLSP